MIKIVTVCGMGLGSGHLMRMNVERVLKRHGVKDTAVEVEVADIGTAQRPGVDIFVTSAEFAPKCRKWAQRLVVVKNVFDEKEMEQALMPIFKELLASKGKKQQSSIERVFAGVLKAILGFTVMYCGAFVIAGVLSPMGEGVARAFGLQIVVPVNEAITALTATRFSAQLIITTVGAFLVHVILARFTPLHYIFLSGHNILFIAAVCVAMLVKSGLPNIQVLLYASLISGILMTVMPAFSMPFMHRATKGAGFAMGHLATAGYCVAGLIGKWVGSDPEQTDSEKIGFLGNLGLFRELFREPLLSMGLAIIVICTLTVIFELSQGDGTYLNPFESVVWSIMQGFTFAAGITIILLGMRMFVGEMVSAFRSISDKFVPGAIPALDCPALFPYGPNSVVIGFFGYTVGMAFMIVFCLIMRYPLVIVPMLFHSFFMGSTAGVFGNATGGRRGAFLGASLHGFLNTSLQAFLFTLIDGSGLNGAMFADTDYCITGIIIGKLSSFMPLALLVFAIILALATWIEVRITRPLLAREIKSK
nr:PTS ascorbate transporter subunit IIC [Chloroflexota bacterium]